MKNIFAGIIVLLLICEPVRSERKFNIVATTPELAAIACEIAGEAGIVHTIARPDQDPHYLQAKPSHMVTLRHADAVIYTGLQLEIGWLPRLLEGARNPVILPGRAGNLNASDAIGTFLEVPGAEVDRSMGDVHPEGNPHFIYDPRNGVEVAGWLARRLAELDPGSADLYIENAEKFKIEMDGLIKGWERGTAHLKGRRIIAYHKQWEYLVEWLGLELVAYIEDKPGIPPSPRHVRELEQLIPAEGISFLFKAHFVPSRAPAILADRTGAKLVVLPGTVTGAEGNETYGQWIGGIIEILSTSVNPDGLR